MVDTVAGEWGQGQADLGRPPVPRMSLDPPMTRETWIDRPRLLQRLEETADSQVLLVVAGRVGQVHPGDPVGSRPGPGHGGLGRVGTR